MIIAEIAQAHDGSLGNAHAFIDALAGTGVDAIKFQTHIAEAESSSFEPFRVKFSKQDSTRFDYWKRMEFTPDQWKGIKDHCEEKNLEFLSSPFSNAAVDLLEEIGVKRYKIGSGELGNFLMLERIAKTGKPIIMSSGMSSFEELDKTFDFLKPFGNSLSILQCTTAYPTQPDQWGLNVIAELKERYHVPVGYSDHSGDIYACLAAASLGSEIFEFHVVFDKRQFGPDSHASITIDQTKVLCSGIKQIQNALKNPIVKSDNQRYSELKVMFGKSLAVNKFLKKGHFLTLDDLESKKPGDRGIPASDYQMVIGKKLNKNLDKWDFLTSEDINSY
ncbi:MAG: N-acetylneuraminate synthase family protein [Algoriphagus sp.]|uniref:N-acetylneuraminate synthase family protein n=1 Tax=Algoriphagus sp. TaxID=1872435 RepID=UPI0017F33884|nr:N-acetylneuraminate synthase family protein [Algoriphagus sp.]NVJ86778.1 N-acetylneuraminate synthase family protein [Algoriphagus sp.]